MSVTAAAVAAQMQDDWTTTRRPNPTTSKVQPNPSPKQTPSPSGAAAEATPTRSRAEHLRPNSRQGRDGPRGNRRARGHRRGGTGALDRGSRRLDCRRPGRAGGTELICRLDRTVGADGGGHAGRSRPCSCARPGDRPAYRRRAAATDPLAASRRCRRRRSWSAGSGSRTTPTSSARSSCWSRAAIATCTARSCCRRTATTPTSAVLFMHNEGYSTMCGHGIIAITTGADRGRPLPGDACRKRRSASRCRPGIVAANGRDASHSTTAAMGVDGVRFQNVPSYLRGATSLVVAPDGARAARRGRRLRLAAASTSRSAAPTTASSTPPSLGLRVVPEQADGAAPRRRGDHRRPAPRPHADASDGPGSRASSTARSSSTDDPAHLAGRASHATPTIRNVTIFADAELDRSPCGSGTSALLAQPSRARRIEAGHARSSTPASPASRSSAGSRSRRAARAIGRPS